MYFVFRLAPFVVKSGKPSGMPVLQIHSRPVILFIEPNSEFGVGLVARVEIAAAVLTISDAASRGEREDTSGPAVIAEIQKLGGTVAVAEVLPDDRELISAKLRLYADRGDINLICTTGGTGFAPRDNTPEATRDVIEKEAPGLAELMRLRSLDSTPLAPLSRAVCGIRGTTLIINLPGSLRGAVENFTAIRQSIPHAIGLLTEQSRKCAS